jgi:hypothetical protein
MKKTAFFLMVLFVSTLSKAQDEKCFTKGTSAINLGVGIGNSINYNANSDVRPIFTGSYEYAVAKAGPGIIGVGVSVSCLSYSNPSPDPILFGYTPNYIYKNISTTVVVGLRASYHPDFFVGKKYDVYGVIQLNVYNYINSSTSDNPNYPSTHNNSVQIYPSLLIGARYFFVPNFGVFSEFGFDFSVIKAGVSLKFGGK